MDARVLAHVMRGLPPIDDADVLVGTNTADDAGVYRLSADLALVQSVDFFTAIVDDPRTFGRIAAANALSDIYAMGARPLSALAIAAFPAEGLDIGVLVEILKGGIEKAHEAGIHVIGGHTLKDAEPKYGLAVTGVAHPDRIVRNSTARPGDALILTKPLGPGILTTARRRDVIDEAALGEAVYSMETLNRAAAEAMTEIGADAATDVTGFGLLGHLGELASASRVGAEINAQAVPVFERALELATDGCAPGGTQDNLEAAEAAGVTFDAAVSAQLRLVLCDAQTSGGLLIALPESKAAGLLARLQAAGVRQAALIGRLTAQLGIAVR